MKHVHATIFLCLAAASSASAAASGAGGQSPARAAQPGPAPDGSYVVADTWRGVGTPAVVLQRPVEVEVGSDGAVYVLDSEPRVLRYRDDGRAVDELPYVGTVSADGGPDGSAYVTDGVQLVRFTPDGSPSWTAPVGRDGEPRAEALAYDDQRDEVWVLDSAAGLLNRFGDDGAASNDLQLPATGPEPRLWVDLSADGSGQAYVLDRLEPAVEIMQVGAAPRHVPLPGRPRRMSAGPDGRIFILERDGWVRRYDDQGSRTAAFDATRFDVAQSSEPSDLAVGPDGSVYVTDAAADIVSRFVWDPRAQAAKPPGTGATCRSFPGKAAAPSVIELGQTVEVRLALRGGCGSDVSVSPLDVMLILDRSRSMRGEKLDVAKAAAIGFVTQLDLANSRVGVVAFSLRAALALPLSNDEDALRRAIQDIQIANGTSIDAGLEAARVELEARRRAQADPVFVLLSDGENTFGRNPVLREADAAKAAGVEVFTIGIQADEELMRAVASDPDHYFAAEGVQFLYDIFDKIAQQISASVLFQAIDVIDEVPSNMRYVPDSAEPAATFDGQALRWRLDDVPFNGFGLRYLLEPLEPGDWPTNVQAWGDYTDGYGNDGRSDFPVPQVRVVAPTPTPTATATPTPTATSTPTPTVSPTPTPTPVPVPIFLPLALRERCVPGQQRVDVALVIDASSSMLEPTTAGRTKLEAAEDAARTFVDQLELTHDQAAIITFNRTAHLLQRLTGDRSKLHGALGRVRVEKQTRIDLGVELAHLELIGRQRRPGNLPVMIVLTDGRANPVAPDVAVARAQEAKGHGIVVFTIGLGRDLDYGALSRMASYPPFFYVAPDAEDLRRIYQGIAVTIPCTAEEFWGRR